MSTERRREKQCRDSGGVKRVGDRTRQAAAAGRKKEHRSAKTASKSHVRGRCSPSPTSPSLSCRRRMQDGVMGVESMMPNAVAKSQLEAPNTYLQDGQRTTTTVGMRRPLLMSSGVE